jgi:hypothetical protein
MSQKKTVISLMLVTVVAVGIGIVIGAGVNQGAEAASSTKGISPVDARARDFYAPNSEDLAPDEMRLIACGTGMPTARPKQAASCWLLELGNGDKFLFDLGTGSAERSHADPLQLPRQGLPEPPAYRPLR